MAYAKETLEEFPNILKDWFEELLDLNEYFYITDDGKVDFVVEENHSLSRRRMAIGNIFKTEEEAEKYLEYLKAKAIIKQDAKGFKPNWSDDEQPKHYGHCHVESERLWRDIECTEKRSTIYFKSVKDIEESLDNHPDEWKAYLTYEQ